MMPWQDALKTYRRRSIEERGGGPARRAMFVLCSEDHAAAALVAACAPVVTLQTLGGALAPLDAAARATFEHALVREGVRHIVVCGHDGCAAHGAAGDGAADVRAQCRSIVGDPRVGELVRAHRVKVRALLLDEAEGDLYACDVETGRRSLLDDDDFARLLASFEGREA